MKRLFQQKYVCFNNYKDRFKTYIKSFFIIWNKSNRCKINSWIKSLTGKCLTGKRWLGSELWQYACMVSLLKFPPELGIDIQYSYWPVDKLKGTWCPMSVFFSCVIKVFDSHLVSVCPTCCFKYFTSSFCLSGLDNHVGNYIFTSVKFTL